MRREQNVGAVERGIRIAGGGGAALVGIVLLLGGPGSFFVGVALVALTLLGIDFFVTGLTGYCPLYHRLGWSTVPRRQQRVS